MFSSNKDLFDFIRSLVEKLDSIGEKQWSIEFREAMNISFMPGEVFGAILTTLNRFIKTEIPQKLNIETELHGAVASLNKALGINDTTPSL